MKLSKFLTLGTATILAAGLFSSQANAQGNAIDPSALGNLESQQQISSSIPSGIFRIINEQREAGFLKENAEIKVNIIEPVKVIDPETKKEIVSADLSGNHAKLVENVCKVNLAFDSEGNAPRLAGDDGILSTTKLMNPTQKEMMRQFIALHESFHCEFANIENPIAIEGKSKSFNEKINYYLKDLPTLPVSGFGHLGYIDTLNENFADIAATGVLLKKYGKDDPNLQFVLRSVQTQRHASYLEGDIDNHFTHIGLKDAMSDKSINKLTNAQDGEEFKQTVLEIANKSVQQLMAQRKDLTEKMFSESVIQLNLVATVTRWINYEAASPEQKSNFSNKTSWKNNVKQGFMSDMATAVLKGEDIQKKVKSVDFNDPDAKQADKSKIIEYAADLLDTKSISYFLNRDKEKFPEYMKEFKETVYQQNEKNVNDFDNKDNIVSKMLQLRNNFLESTQNNSNTMKLK